ncbi:MAG: serine/threonine-protein kinase [Burkholderiaceae bacterium]
MPLPPRRSGNALPDGTHLSEFEIRATVGEGGFGIVYAAWDHVLKRTVAIKEYMPWSLAGRVGSQVVPSSRSAAETFALGLHSFINEAQLLASFDHPSLLKVYRFWEDNGTAYMVMPFYRGVTLKRALAKLDAPPEEGWLKQQLGHLLDALEVMHAESCFHRDIAPDNILLLEEGIPLLLDFGAARRVLSDSTQTLTAFLKPGYAPVEQYATMPHAKQGPWTDLYALASVVHYAITGHTPPESVGRLVSDTCVPLAQAAAGRYSDAFLRAIDHALGVRPEQRPQSVAQMRAELALPPPRLPARKAIPIPTSRRRSIRRRR